MPVYQFICEKHGGFEKITIKAEWDEIKCPKCGDKSKVEKKGNLERKNLLENIYTDSPVISHKFTNSHKNKSFVVFGSFKILNRHIIS